MELVVLTPDARQRAAEAYVTLEADIRRKVWAFVRRYGGDFEELLGMSHIAFLSSFQELEQGKVSKDQFRNHTLRWVWFGLLDMYRSYIHWGNKVEVRPNEAVLEKTADREDRVTAMFEDLGHDAAVALQLIIDTPAELMQLATARGGEPRNLRSVIREYLRGVGWTANRITESFEEIRRAL